MGDFSVLLPLLSLMHDDQKNEWLLNAAEKVLNVIELKIKFHFRPPPMK